MKANLNRFIGWLMAACMTLAFLPPAAWAASSHEQIRQQVMGVLYGGASGGSLLADFSLTGSNYSGWHQGIDFQLKEGVPVYAIAEGTVTRVTDPSAEEYQLSTIAIYNERCDLTVIYLHTKGAVVSSGDSIAKGQQIAREGKKGNKVSITPHTHVEIRKGRQTGAAVSLGATSQANPDPYPLLEQLLGNSGESTSSRKFNYNVSKTAVSQNLSVSALPDGTRDGTVQGGESYYFNFAGTSNLQFRKIVLSVQPVGASGYSDIVVEDKSNGYFRWVNYLYTFANQSGTFHYYWTITDTNGTTKKTDSESLNVEGRSSSTDNGSGESTSSRKFNYNISKTAVSQNLSVSALPDGTRDGTVQGGELYYFNFAGTSNLQFRKLVLSVQPVGASGYSDIVVEDKSSGYFRWANYQYSFANQSGTFQYYWTITDTDGVTKRTNPESITVYVQQPNTNITCKVTYDPNGGIGSVRSEKVAYGKELVLLPGTIFAAPDGKRFKTWSINGEEYISSKKYYVNGDMTIKAIWENEPHKHQLSHTAAIPASESAAGSREYWRCTGCGKYFSNANATNEITASDITIPALVHKHQLSHTSAVAATESKAGNKEYWYCAGCGKYFADASGTNEISKSETTIPALGHKHQLAHTAAVAATEDKAGNKEYWYCAGCGKYFAAADGLKEISKSEITIPALGHKHQLVHVDAISPSCTLAGSKEYWRCSGCGKIYADAEALAESSIPEITIYALGHDFQAGICTRCEIAEKVESEPQEVHFLKDKTYLQGQFGDVASEQWFTNSVAEAYELGLMKGKSENSFDPYGDVTIAESITMAARIHSIYTSGRESFDQSIGGAWYQTYLDYAYRNGIIDEAYYSRDVTQKGTRAQFAEIFANSLPENALSAINEIMDGSIPDIIPSSSYEDAVYRLYRAGVLTGGDARGTFSPQSFITRAEAAAIVSRMAESSNRMSFSLR